MKKGLKYTGGLLRILVCLSLLSGCSLLGKKPAESLKTRQIVKKIQNTNHDIMTSRGTGNLLLTRNGRTEIFRIAWVAKWPLSLRMTLLSSGIPLETIAADGESVTLVSHTGQHPPHTINRSNPSLAKFISLPVKLGEIIALLTGRIPLKGGEDGIWQMDKQHRSEFIFKNWMGNPTEKIFLNKKNQVIEYWQLSPGTPPVIKLYFNAFKKFGRYTIAEKIVFTDVQNRRLLLEITSFSPNISLEDHAQIFHLTDPG